MKFLLNNLPTLTSRRAAYLLVMLLVGLTLARVTPGATAGNFGLRPESRLGKLMQRVSARVHRFATAAPSTVTTQTVDVGTNADVGRRISAALVNGTPALSYYNVSEKNLMFARNSAADGSGTWTITTVDSAGSVGRGTSLAVVNGNPAIAYYADTDGSIRFARNSAADGSGAWTVTTVDNSGNNIGGTPSLVALSDGTPAIAYRDTVNQDLKFARNSVADGSGTWTITTVASAGNQGAFASLAVLSTGVPAIAYYDQTNTNVKFARNSAADGSGAWTSSTVESATAGDYSLAIIAGNPTVSFYKQVGAGRELRYARNSSANGSGTWTVITVDGSAFESAASDTSLTTVAGNPAISYQHRGSADLKFARNSAADGSGTWTLSTVDNVGDVEGFTSMIFTGSTPAIGYYDSTNGDLKFARNAAADGSGTWTLATVDAGNANKGDVGQFSSLAVVGGNPAISYYDATNTALKFARNSAADGSGAWAFTTVDDTSATGQYTSLAIAGGNPAISYYDETSRALKFARNSAPDGSGAWTRTTVETILESQSTSLAVVGGNPAIGYYDGFNSALKFARNSGPNGFGAWTRVIVDNSASVGQYTSLAAVEGNPALSYYDATNTALKFARNSTTDGSGAWTITTVDDAADVGQYTSLAVVEGNPAISYYDATNSALKFARNTAADGSGTWTITTVDNAASVGQHTSLAVIYGAPAISYYDASSKALKFARNSAPDGSGAWTITTADASSLEVGHYTSLAQVNCGAGISYYDAGDGNLKFAHISVANAAPTFSPVAVITRQQGSPAGAAVTIGTVSDAETSAGALMVTHVAGGTATGITATGLSNTNGTITALVSASCTATAGTVRFQVSDGCLTSTAELQVNVTANTAPTLTYGNASVIAGAATNNNPTTATDNGSISGYAVQSQGTYTGTVSVDAAGVVSTSNAAPPGTHTITIRATDDCGATSDASFTLNVSCPSTVVTNGDDSGVGSLRQIIADACPGSTVTFQAGVTTVALTTAELFIDKNLTIDGGANGVTITRSGAAQFRIFNIGGGTVAFSTLTISNGGHASQAGGIQNTGDLTLTNCAITGNTAPQAGGVQNDGTLTVNGCTFSGNIGNNSSFNGGGLVNYGATANLTNSTFSGNETGRYGGGIYVGQGTVNLTNCTLANNHAVWGGGLFLESGSNVTLKNTIAVNNTGTAGGGSANLSGNALVNSASSYNLIGSNGTGGLTNGTNNNQVGVTNPLLGSLANNGGTAQTIALLPGSPAINAGTNAGAPATDQRGVSRPQQSTVDIGAYESRGFTLAVNSGDNQSTNINSAFASPLSVTISSANGETVDGGRVTFTAPPSGARATISNATPTISSGVATTGTVTANNTAGSYTVTASATGVSTGVNFALTNICPTLAITAGPTDQTVCVGSTAAFNVTATGTGLSYQWRKNGADIPSATGSSYTTPATTLADSGAVYSVVVSGTCGTPVTSGNATLTVNGGVITAQPVSQVVCEGSAATVSVTATGTNLSYQWRKGGTNISGATDSSYTIPAFSAADAGNYDVVVSSTGCASVTSNAATLSLLGPTVMTNAMPLWGGRLNGTQFEVGTASTWPAAESPDHAFDGLAAKSLIRYTANAGYVFTPASCNPAGKIINQLRIYTANDFEDRDPASYALYGTNSTLSGSGPFDAALFTLISSGSLALPSGRNFSTLDNANSQLISFANATAYQSYMLIFPTIKNPGTVFSTQIGEVKFYPENYQPTLTVAPVTRVQGTAASATIGNAASGTLQAPNALTATVSNDGANFGASATLNGVTVSSLAVAADGTVTASVAAGCAASDASFTLQVVNDKNQAATAALNVTVTANPPPTLSYSNVSVSAGGLTTNTPTLAMDQGSIASYAVQSPGSYTGTISVNASGVISISNAAPVGTHTITIRATDNCGAPADASFTLTVGNNPPTITPGAALTRQQGTAGTGATIATVSDTETAADSLAVTATTVPTGISVSSISNSTGTITANVAAGCLAAVGANTVVLTVTDSHGGTNTANLIVNVTANSAPALSYGNVLVNAGNATTNSPASATDSGSITGYAVQSQGTYTGTLSVNGSGVVSVSNAAPVGSHTITIRATDNCGATTDAQFTLTVGNNAPTITAGGNFTRQQASPAGAAVTIATVNDSETAAGNLTVTATTVPAGITVASINNTGGTITATLAAGCAATLGNHTVGLTVTDGDGGTNTASLTVNVMANTAPTLTYDNVSVLSGGATTTSPSAATDNGNIVSYAVQAQGTYAGVITVNPSGVVSISSAAPVGSHTITMRATDNCGTTTDATFTLTVGNNLPTITAGAALTRQRGSAGTIGPLATVNDAETPAGNLAVSATTVPAGLTVTGITNTAGAISATVAADCTAALGNNTVVLTVTDGNGSTATANLTVSVTANTAPTLTYAAASVNAGAATTNAPTTASDNGSITGYTVQNAGTYAGTISVNAAGVVSVSNAAPVGSHTLTIRATDNCGTTTEATFTLTVGNNLPSITAEAALTRQQGTAGSLSPMATVSDGETPVGSLTVQATTVPAGLSVTGISNTNGAITATIAAGCNAVVGNNTVVLTVTDGNGGTATASLTINVTANSAPALTYSSPQSVAFGSSLNVNPATASDNGTVTYQVQSGHGLTTAPAVNASGVVSITNAGPAGAHTITVQATDNCGATTNASFTLNVGCPTITIMPPAVSTGSVGTGFSQSFTQLGGAAPVTFSLHSGTLPSGLTLAADGTLSGTPTQTGTFPLTVKATDANQCTGTSASYTLVIQCAALTVNPATLPSAQLGVAFSQQLTVANGAGAVSFQVTSGALPQGLTLTTAGLLSGMPASLTSATFEVQATDANGCTGGRAYTLTPTCPTLSLSALPATTAGTAYNQTITVSPVAGAPYSLAVTSGNLPTGLTLSAAGSLSGTPTTPGTYTFTVTATGFGTACTGSQSYSLTVHCPSITLAPASLPNGQQGGSYTQNLTASPAGPAYSYTVASGALPPGLTLDAQTGALTGTPTASGTYSFVVQAANGSCTGTQNYTLLIAACAPLAVNPASLPNGQVGAAYNQSLSAAGSGGPYSFAVPAGTVPAGLTLTAQGVLSGTPTATGTTSFTVTVTGAGGCTGTRSYTLTITCAPVTFAPTTLPQVTAGVAYSQTLTVSPTGTYSFNVLIGNLPPGLNLDPQSGVLSGLATVTGSYQFTVQVLNGSCSGTQSYTLAVVCPTITLTPTSLPGATVGTAYSQSVSAAPSGNYSFAKTSGTLPGGLTLSAAGVLSGTPTATGTFTFTITATGFGTCSGSRTYTLTVAAGCTTITLPSLPATGKLGVSYYGNLAATTPSGSYTFTRDSGTLPPGLVIDNLFTALTGKPTALGTYAFTLKATRSNGCTGTRAYSITISSAQAALAQVADYDGDGQTDPALWTQASGRWSILLSGRPGQRHLEQTATWGDADDLTLLGDYDGDGRTDVAVFRPANGTWYIQRSSDGTALVKAWGAAGDVPVPGDYDGDGQTDLAIWRPSEGHWYLWRSHTQDYAVVAWGAGAAPYLDVPVPGDYDGDGKTDLAVFRRATGTWLVKLSGAGQVLIKAWGVGTDVPVAGDYDGDGRTDVAVWRGATGEWFVWRSAEQRYQITAWGAAWAGDVPAPGDYDGDGVADCAVWRAAEGRWYVRLSGAATAQTQAQGQRGDLPVAGRNTR
jgi:hypothetical protein